MRLEFVTEPETIDEVLLLPTLLVIWRPKANRAGVAVGFLKWTLFVGVEW